MVLELIFCASILCASPSAGSDKEHVGPQIEQPQSQPPEAPLEPQSPPNAPATQEPLPAASAAPQLAVDPPPDAGDQPAEQIAAPHEVAAAQAEAAHADAARAEDAAKAAAKQAEAAKAAAEKAKKVAQEKQSAAKLARKRAEAAKAEAAKLLADITASATNNQKPVSRERSYTVKTTTEKISVEKSSDGTHAKEKTYTEKTTTEKVSVEKATGPAESMPAKTDNEETPPDQAADAAASNQTTSNYRPVPYSFDELRPPEQLPMNRGPFGSAAGEAVASQPERPVFTEVWTVPAHFPRPAYRPSGAPLSGRDGLLIFEGMSLEMFADGRYTIKFVGEAPATPVELRLQFTLFGPDRRSAGTITLPQILIPSQGKDGQGLVRTWKFTQTGYSHAIEEAHDTFRSQTWDSSRLYVHRDGTARYGTRPW